MCEHGSTTGAHDQAHRIFRLEPGARNIGRLSLSQVTIKGIRDIRNRAKIDHHPRKMRTADRAGPRFFKYGIELDRDAELIHPLDHADDSFGSLPDECSQLLLKLHVRGINKIAKHMRFMPMVTGAQLDAGNDNKTEA